MNSYFLWSSLSSDLAASPPSHHQQMIFLQISLKTEENVHTLPGDGYLLAAFPNHVIQSYVHVNVDGPHICVSKSDFSSTEILRPIVQWPLSLHLSNLTSPKYDSYFFLRRSLTKLYKPGSRYPPVWTSQMLGLEVCTTLSSLKQDYWFLSPQTIVLQEFPSQ